MPQESKRDRAAQAAYPCPYCGEHQTYAELQYPHHCKGCGERIVWYSVLGTVEYGWGKHQREETR